MQNRIGYIIRILIFVTTCFELLVWTNIIPASIFNVVPPEFIIVDYQVYILLPIIMIFITSLYIVFLLMAGKMRKNLDLCIYIVMFLLYVISFAQHVKATYMH